MAHLLSGHAAGELTDLERVSVKRHLSSCRRCEREIAEYRRVLALARSLPPPTPSPALEARLRRSLADAVQGLTAESNALDETRPQRPLP
ncbi:zf-HC2 domain-containing protein [bacterium]|nr:zf-HC2 domain-containing protein [bacterium]